MSDIKDKIDEVKSVLGKSTSLVRSLEISYLIFLTYMGITVLQTSDMDLLNPYSGLNLPIIGVKVPLIIFYIFIPILSIILHLNILIHLFFHQKKLEELSKLSQFSENKGASEPINGKLLPPLLFNYLVGLEGKEKNFLKIIVKLSFFILPLFSLLIVQLRFADYQSFSITLIHTLIILVDFVAVLYFLERIFKTQKLDFWSLIMGYIVLFFLLFIISIIFTSPIIAIFLLFQWGLVLYLYYSVVIRKRYFRNYSQNSTKKRIQRALNRKLIVLLRKGFKEKFNIFLQNPLIFLMAFVSLIILQTSIGGKSNGAYSESKFIQSIIPKIELYNDTISPNLDLSGRNFRFAQFANIKMTGVNFSRSDLTGARLINCNFSKGKFIDAKLRSITLENSIGIKATFINSILNNALILSSNLDSTLFDFSKMHGVKVRSTSLVKSHFIESRGIGAEFFRCDLYYSSFRSAEFPLSHFFKSHFLYSDFVSADLRGVWLESSFPGCTFELTDVRSASFIEANLKGAFMDKVFLRGTRNLNSLDYGLFLNSISEKKFDSSVVKKWYQSLVFNPDIDSKIVEDSSFLERLNQALVFQNNTVDYGSFNSSIEEFLAYRKKDICNFETETPWLYFIDRERNPEDEVSDSTITAINDSLIMHVYNNCKGNRDIYKIRDYGSKKVMNFLRQASLKDEHSK